MLWAQIVVVFVLILNLTLTIEKEGKAIFNFVCFVIALSILACAGTFSRIIGWPN